MNSTQTSDAENAKAAPKLTRWQIAEKRALEQAAYAKKLKEAAEEKERKRQKLVAKRTRKLAARQNETERKLETRLKILLGFTQLKATQADPSVKSTFERLLAEYVTEDRDIAVLQHFGYLKHLSPAKTPAIKD